jgi:hypothetical protein
MMKRVDYAIMIEKCLMPLMAFDGLLGFSNFSLVYFMTFDGFHQAFEIYSFFQAKGRLPEHKLSNKD